MQNKSTLFRRRLFSTQDGICFSVSLFCHLVLCLTLAIILIANRKVGKQELAFSLEDDSSTMELAFSDTVMDKSLSEDQSHEPDTLASETLLSEAVILTKPIGSIPVESFDEDPNDDSKATKASLASSSRREPIDPAHAKSRATFFGAQAYGDRFVFVIDSSKSMRGFRWESLCVELVRALRSLSPDQEFFVISFDAAAHPMLGLVPPKDLFLKPTSRNIKRVQNWLKSIEHGYETFPSSALAIALRLTPDAIFLLSDGEIRDNTIQCLREWNQLNSLQINGSVAIPIHTVLLHSDAGYSTLEQIAQENQGTFTPVVRHP